MEHNDFQDPDQNARKLGAAVRGLSVTQIEAISILSQTQDSVSQIARKVGAPDHYVKPVLNALRKVDFLAQRDMEKKA